MQQVKVYVRGDNDGAVIETTSDGSLYERGGSTYILYEEMSEGAEKPARSLIKISSNEEVSIKKQGPITTDMHFAVGQMTVMDYHTPYGLMSFLVTTSKLEIVTERDTTSTSEVVSQADDTAKSPTIQSAGSFSTAKNIILNIEYTLEPTDDPEAKLSGEGTMHCKVQVKITA